MPFKADQEDFPPLPGGLVSTGLCDQLFNLFFYLVLKTFNGMLLLPADSKEGGAWCSFQFIRESRCQIAISLPSWCSLVPALIHLPCTLLAGRIVPASGWQPWQCAAVM